MLTAAKPLETSSEVQTTHEIPPSMETNPINSNSSTPLTKHKSPKCRPSVEDLEKSNSIDPLANSPLLSQANNSSNSNANEYNSADSEKDALIMSKTSSNF